VTIVNFLFFCLAKHVVVFVELSLVLQAKVLFLFGFIFENSFSVCLVSSYFLVLTATVFLRLWFILY